MEKKTQVILKRKEVLGNYNPEEYVSEVRIFLKLLLLFSGGKKKKM